MFSVATLYFMCETTRDFILLNSYMYLQNQRKKTLNSYQYSCRHIFREKNRKKISLDVTLIVSGRHHIRKKSRKKKVSCLLSNIFPKTFYCCISAPSFPPPPSPVTLTEGECVRVRAGAFAFVH